MESLGKQNHMETPKKPMTYSESVKQAKPRIPPCNENKTSAKTKVKAKTAGKLAKERSELSLSMKMKSQIEKTEASYDGLISEKEGIIRDYIDQINDHLLLLKPVYCHRKYCKHEQSNCVPASKKITELNDKIVRKVFILRNSINKLKDMVCVARERKERKRELVLLFTKIKEENEDGMTVKYHRKYYERYYEKLKTELERLQREITQAEELCVCSGPLKAEEFMKNSIRTLGDNIKARTSALSEVECEINAEESVCEEKRNELNSLQEQIKKIRKEFSEPVINRLQYNLCLKENLKYDQDLGEIITERDAVQYQYGAIMEEYKALQCQLQSEENAKEKLFMEIMSQLEEGRNIEIEHEGIAARINQMHAEIAVRHGFMHARQKAIDDLCLECEELNKKLNAAIEEEDELKRKNKEIGEDLTNVLFDICFAISWKAADEELAAKEKEKNSKNNAFNDLRSSQRKKCFSNIMLIKS